MKIQKFLSQHRSDFSAVMECEHCGHTDKLTTGYQDAFYHERVIPAMRCSACGKNRAGEVEHTDTSVSLQTI
jgi:Zn ribbon nucleic-acid-binding protein